MLRPTDDAGNIKFEAEKFASNDIGIVPSSRWPDALLFVAMMVPLVMIAICAYLY